MVERKPSIHAALAPLPKLRVAGSSPILPLTGPHAPMTSRCRGSRVSAHGHVWAPATPLRAPPTGENIRSTPRGRGPIRSVRNGDLVDGIATAAMNKPGGGASGTQLARTQWPP
jgi:hypothetical protein